VYSNQLNGRQSDSKGGNISSCEEIKRNIGDSLSEHSNHTEKYFAAIKLTIEMKFFSRTGEISIYPDSDIVKWFITDVARYHLN